MRNEQVHAGCLNTMCTYNVMVHIHCSAPVTAGRSNRAIKHAHVRGDRNNDVHHMQGGTATRMYITCEGGPQHGRTSHARGDRNTNAAL